MAALLVGGLAMLVQVTTPELRCHVNLDKNGCSHVNQPSPRTVTESPNVDKSSPKTVMQSPIATPTPSPTMDKSDVSVKSSLPSPQVAVKDKVENLQDKLIGSWTSSVNACGVNGDSFKYRKIIMFNKNRTVLETMFFVSNSSESVFFSTKNYETRMNIQVTYEWIIEEAFLYMKIVDKVSSVDSYSVDGKSVKINASSVQRLKDAAETAFLKGLTMKYKILSIEESSMVLEKMGGNSPCNHFISKFERVKIQS